MDETTVAKPLALPKFTFLCGPNTPEKFELARLISNQDTEMWLGDFEAPLREATVALFFENDLMGTDLRKVDKIPGSTILRVEDWLDSLKELVEAKLGSQFALGELALRHWESEGLEGVFDRFLYRDLVDANDAMPFVVKFGVANCLHLHLDTARGGACPGIWLPCDTAAKNFEFLRHELETTKRLP